jgi:hypothetical protein
MKRNRIALAATTVAALLLLLTVCALPASANTVQYLLTSDHCSNGGCLSGQGSAGTITVTDVSGGVTVDVTLNSNFGFINGGFDAVFGFNLLNTPSITYSGVNSGWVVVGGNPQSASTANNGNGLHMDGTGYFQYGLDCPVAACGHGASNPYYLPLDFTITGTGLTTASFTTNAIGEYFAVDIIGPNGNTGGVDASVQGVPDGGITVMLLGGALVGLATLRRRFRA